MSLVTLVRSSLFAVFVLTLFPFTLHAQAPYNLTDPLQVLTFKDGGGECVPQKAVDNDPHDLAKYGSGCCAAPGRRGCVHSSSDTTYPVCFNLDHALLADPYGSGEVCSLPSPSPDPELSTIGREGHDVTFYVTSDLHFFRRTFNLTDQLRHVQVVKNFYSTKALWPAGTGLATGTPIQKPVAVIVDGDMTTYGAADNLGAFRTTWERGTVPDSIQYPILFGLGNHELNSDETPDDTHRMFEYLQARMANTHIDPESGNYSWDWNGVHMVQLNTWAGDKTSEYVRPSDGLGWLKNDLETYVGNSTRPVMFFQHYLFTAVNTSKSISPTNDDYWPTDANAIDAAGNKTGKGYETWFSIIKNYNVIGMFGGHDHCLGVTSSDLANLPVTGPTYPEVAGYGLPIDDFDDGSGGDTRGTVAQDPGQEDAGVGNPCKATEVYGRKIAQTAVGSFLVTHLSDHYLDVATVSWNDKTSAPYFDRAEGMPGALASCRKRINSQYIAAPGNFQVVKTSTGYTVTSTSGSRPDIPVALSFGSHAGVTGFDFADNCGDPGDKGANHVFYLVNGEQPMFPGKSYSVAVSTTTAGESTDTPQVVLLTPLSGVSVPSLHHHLHVTSPSSSATIDPLFDIFTVYGPPGESARAQISYSGAASNRLTIEPMSTQFDGFGTASFIAHYRLFSPTSGLKGASHFKATISVETGGTGVIQTIEANLE